MNLQNVTGFNEFSIGIDRMLHCPDTVNRWVRNSDDGFKVVRNLDVCENGCSLFPVNDLNVLNCPVEGCNRPRYINQAQAVAARQDGIDLNDESSIQFSPVQQLSVVSVGASLAQMLVNDEKRRMFEYRQSIELETEENRVYRDIFDGEVFKHLVHTDGLFQDPNDIALLIFVDGFIPKHVNGCTMTIVHCLVMNIDPSNRYSYYKHIFH